MNEATRQVVTLPEHTTQPESAVAPHFAERLSDITIASAVARAVRTVPGVVDLSPGVVVPRATFGAGERVTGIVVHHPAPNVIVLEIHVLLSEARCNTAAADVAKPGAGRDAAALNVLQGIAAHIRETVHAAVQGMVAPIVVRADVVIDDLV